MNKLHFWSDIPNDWRSSSSGDANKHANEHGDVVINVKSIAELKDWFKKWVEEDVSFDIVDFHTHGGPGEIQIGSETLGISKINTLYFNNIDRVFNNNAQVIFNGCNVGEGYQGEFFLLKFGEMMLVGGGGKVSGHTGLGFADSLFSGDVYHPFGDWVSANVGVGGSVKLSNHQYLIPEKINERIKSLGDKIGKLESEKSVYASEVLSMRTNLLIASSFAAYPTDRNMFDACDNLRMVEMKLAKIEDRMKVEQIMKFPYTVK